MVIESIQLDRSSSKHLYIQLYAQIKALIEGENIKEDQKLPPIRSLGQRLEVNNVTIVNAYKLLEEEGLIYKKVGSGTFVSPRHKPKREGVGLDGEVYIDEDTKFNSPKDGKEINFATGAPTPDLFPIAPFKRLLNRVLDRDGGYAFGYQKSQGYLPLRESISSYIKGLDIEVGPEEIQIVSGAQQGIDILGKTFLDYGDTVFVERPTYPGAVSVFKSRKANIYQFPIYKDGIDIEQLELKLEKERPKFLYLMPNFQNPTGYSYSKEKKDRLLALASKHDLLIIEDDCLSDLNYSKEDSSSLKSLDKEGRVIYIKSFSKIFMPGLRLAFLIIPPRYYNDILLSKYMSDIFTDGLVQRVLDLYFREDLWEEQLRKLKLTYGRRYEAMVYALKNSMPKGVTFIEPEGGLNIWINLPKEISTKNIYHKALAKGVNIALGSLFYYSNSEDNKIRLAIAAVDREEIEIGIKILSRIINEEMDKEEDYKWDASSMPLI